MSTEPTLRELVNMQQDEIARLDCQLASYQIAMNVINRYPKASYKLLALIEHLTCYRTYSAEDITDVIINAFIDPT